MTGGRDRPSGLAALDEDGRREYWAALALRCCAGLGSRGTCLLLRHFGSAYAAVSNHMSSTSRRESRTFR